MREQVDACVLDGALAGECQAGALQDAMAHSPRTAFVVLADESSGYILDTAGALHSWETTPEGALALLLLLDQIPRNIFRGTPRAYTADAAARAIADRALARLCRRGWAVLRGRAR